MLPFILRENFGYKFYFKFFCVSLQEEKHWRRMFSIPKIQFVFFWAIISLLESLTSISLAQEGPEYRSPISWLAGCNAQRGLQLSRLPCVYNLNSVINWGRQQGGGQKKCPCLGKNSWPKPGVFGRKGLGYFLELRWVEQRTRGRCYEKLMRQATIIENTTKIKKRKKDPRSHLPQEYNPHSPQQTKYLQRNGRAH